jgi:hypothetical protein
MGKENSAPDLCWFLPYEHGLILVKPQQTTQIIMDPLGIQSSLANLDTLQRTGGGIISPQNMAKFQNDAKCFCFAGNFTIHGCLLVAILLGSSIHFIKNFFINYHKIHIKIS